MSSKIIIAIFTILLISSINQVQGQGEEKLVILHTRSGPLVIEFFPEDAPKHVDNFIKLAESGFYDRTIFHRIIKDFMIQGGDNKTKPGGYTETSEWGTGNPGYTIKAEFNDIKHNRGIVSMARSQDPHSAGSQFFIVHNASNFLNGQYTVFGRLATLESYDTLDVIANLQTPPGTNIAFDWGKGEILSTEVVNRLEVGDLLSQGDPERMSIPVPQFEEIYTNEQLGFSYVFPTGWTIEESKKANPNAPDITAFESNTAGFPSYISISVIDDEGKSLNEKATEFKNHIQDSIDSGQNTIVLEESTQIHGMNAQHLILQNKFPTQSGIFLINFDEFTIKGTDKFYVITYTDTVVNFKIKKSQFEESLSSFKIIDSIEIPKELNSEEKPGGGCLIATATFGSELSPQVQKLRETRDNILMNTESGKSFLSSFNQLYYSFSPTIADWERQNPIFKETVRIVITPLLTSLLVLNHVDIDSEAEMLGYGISLIFINIGMYFAAPAYIFHRIRK